MGRNYRICKRCIMDTSDPHITFDKNGYCNHCISYFKHAEKYLFVNGNRKKKIEEILREIKNKGKGKEYDCIVGLSGGVDSTYTAYISRKFGLRPLCVHLDNGWDSELAQKNIEMIVKKLGFDLFTYVIDWEEFKDIQLSYLKASVVDVEVPTDHAITAVLYRVASKRGIKFILSGNNIVTESIMPDSWFHRNKNDLVNLKDIHRHYGTMPLKTFPTLGLLKKIYFHFIKGIRVIPILNFVPYNKEQAKEIIKKELGWKDYGYKHYEQH